MDGKCGFTEGPWVEGKIVPVRGREAIGKDSEAGAFSTGIRGAPYANVEPLDDVEVSSGDDPERTPVFSRAVEVMRGGLCRT